MSLLKIDNKRVLVIPDIHQDIDWVNSILTIEHGNYDNVVFLGDYFDSRKDFPVIHTASKTAQWLKDKLHIGAIGLIGNHDLPYLESWTFNQRFSNKKAVFNICSGFSKSKSIDINKVLHIDDWNKLRPFIIANGWILSHAGFRPLFLKKNLDVLHGELINAIQKIAFEYSPYFHAGFVRGGSAENAGPFWCDFHYDFLDSENIRQIVGHTAKFNNIRNIGNSYCIDGGQTTYAIINPDGSVNFRSTRSDFQVSNLL